MEESRIAKTSFFYFPENTFVYPGEIIDIPHYGQVKQFYVTSVEGDHGSFEVLTHCDESLVQDFASLNMSDGIPCNISKDNVSSKSVDLHTSTSINDSNASDYYSFTNQSTDQDVYDIHPCPSAGNSDTMFTSTPVKVDKKSTNACHNISCSRCSTATVLYYITAAATKIVINNSDDSNSRHNFKEKLTYDLIGGLDKQIQMLKEMVELSIKSPNVFLSYGT